MAAAPATRTWPPASALLAVALGLSGCGQRPAPAIGVLAPLSGPLASRGEALVAGVQLAVDEQDPGRRPALIVGDTGGSARGAAAAFERLAGLGAQVIIGPVATDETAAASLVANSRSVPCVTPAATAAEGLGGGAGFTLRLGASDDAAAASLAGFAEGDLHLSRLALVVDLDSGDALAFADAFSREFQKRRGLVVDSIYYRGSDPDGMLALDRVAGLDVQGALLAGEPADLVPMVTAARSPRLADLILLGGGGWSTPGLHEALSGRVAGAYHTRDFNPEAGTPQVIAFMDGFRRAHARAPDDLAAFGYDAGRAVLSVFDGRLEGAALRDRLADLGGFSGVTGTLALDPGGAALRPPIVIESLHEPGGARVVAVRDG